MAKISKAVIDKGLREDVFADIFACDKYDYEYHKINDRQYGAILVDDNGTERYVRIGVIVAEEREDCTARELMQAEIDDYNAKQVKKAEKAAERAEKAAKDKAKREAVKKAKEEGGE